MVIDAGRVRRLLAMVAETREEEIDCDDCLAGMAEFAEAALLDAEIPEALERIDEHIRACPECSEEYGLLREILREEQDGPGI